LIKDLHSTEEELKKNLLCLGIWRSSGQLKRWAKSLISFFRNTSSKEFLIYGRDQAEPHHERWGHRRFTLKRELGFESGQLNYVSINGACRRSIRSFAGGDPGIGEEDHVRGFEQILSYRYRQKNEGGIPSEYL
jgi:hypothetical protein